MKKQNESMGKLELEIGKDYITDDGNLVVIDRVGDFDNNGFYDGLYKKDIPCFNPKNWREATEEQVVAAFEKHLVKRYGKDWRIMKIKEVHPSLSSSVVISDGDWDVFIVKLPDGWSVYNENGLVYRNGIWVERLEEEPRIHIKEAIKRNTAIHCATEKEAERILNMAHRLGRKWVDGQSYENNLLWERYKGLTCYDLFDNRYCYLYRFKNRDYTIIPSTQIEDLEEKKSTEWTPAPEDIEAMNKEASEKLPIDKVTTRNLDIALRSKSLAPHRCPVCNGSGLVPNGFYMQTGGHWSTTSITPETCRSCGGTGIVWG